MPCHPVDRTHSLLEESWEIVFSFATTCKYVEDIWSSNKLCSKLCEPQAQTLFHNLWSRLFAKAKSICECSYKSKSEYKKSNNATTINQNLQRKRSPIQSARKPGIIHYLDSFLSPASYHGVLNTSGLYQYKPIINKMLSGKALSLTMKNSPLSRYAEWSWPIAKTIEKTQSSSCSNDEYETHDHPKAYKLMNWILVKIQEKETTKPTPLTDHGQVHSRLTWWTYWVNESGIKEPQAQILTSTSRWLFVETHTNRTPIGSMLASKGST